MTAPTDLVVVMPGILGSTLRRDGSLVWAPSAGSALRAIATFGASLRRLEPPEGIGDQHPCDGVEPDGPAGRRPHRAGRHLPRPGPGRGRHVPIVGACRADVRMDSNTLRRVPDKHGNLHRNAAALDEMEGILTASDIIIKAAKPIALRVGTHEFALAGQPITVEVTSAEPARHAIRLAVTSETSTLVEARRIGPSAGPVSLDGLAPGAYTIDVAGTGPGSPYAPVSSEIPIWES